MKHFLLRLLLLFAISAGAQTSSNVTLNVNRTTGLLANQTNFFAANSNALLAVVNAVNGTSIRSLNGNTNAAQTIAAGTSGTDFAVASSAGTTTLNLPTASASNRGALSSTDWSTFNGKMGSLNGLTATSQTFASGTAGTDFAIVSSTSTHTFNLPTASASNRGALSSADWSTFNGKLGSLNAQTGSSQTFASGTSGTDFAISSSGNVHTFNLPTASASTRGALSSADWSTFNGKVGTSRQVLAGTGLSGGGALSGDVTLSLASTSASIASALSDETGSGALVFGTSPTITTPTISGAVSWPAGTRQTFAPNATTPGFSPGSVSSDPSTPSNGDIWLQSTTGRLRARLNGATVDVSSGWQQDFNTTAITYGASIAVDLNANQYQTATLTGDTTLTTSNRPSSGGRGVTVFFTASGAQRVVTLNASWKNYGSTSTITIPSGKEAYLTLMALGPNETDVRANFGLTP